MCLLYITWYVGHIIWFIRYNSSCLLQSLVLEFFNRIHIWEMSPQLSCGDIFRIWAWNSTGNNISITLRSWKNNGTEEIGAYFTIEHLQPLTHWGRVTHICVSQLITIVSDNGLSPDRRQAIIFTNIHEILLFGPVGRNFSEILIEIYAFSFKKINLKMSSEKWRPSCLGLNVLS